MKKAIVNTPYEHRLAVRNVAEKARLVYNQLKHIGSCC
jgi:hypothetical protein